MGRSVLWIRDGRGAGTDARRVVCLDDALDMLTEGVEELRAVLRAGALDAWPAQRASHMDYVRSGGAPGCELWLSMGGGERLGRLVVGHDPFAATAQELREDPHLRAILGERTMELAVMVPRCP